MTTRFLPARLAAYIARSARCSAWVSDSPSAQVTAPPEKLVEAVNQVINGRKYVTPEIAQALIENLQAPKPVMPHESLSDREFQTLKLIATGHRLSDIAEALALSPKTVSVYRARILEKMAMSNNAELTHYAIKHGLVD